MVEIISSMQVVYSMEVIEAGLPLNQIVARVSTTTIKGSPWISKSISVSDEP